MGWDKVSADLAVILDDLVAGYNCQKKPMFGCPVYFVNNNMFTGVKGGDVFIRLSESDRAAIQVDCDEVTPFEPRPNFIMKEYVSIPESKLSDQQFMSKWINRSYSFVLSLPPKVKKDRKQKK